MSTLSFKTSGFVAQNVYFNLTNRETGVILTPVINLLFHPNNFSILRTRVVQQLPNYNVNVILSNLVWRALAIKNLDIPVYWSTPSLFYSTPVSVKFNKLVTTPLDPKGLLIFNNLALN